jgi:uncharacterized protein DUF5999
MNGVSSFAVNRIKGNLDGEDPVQGEDQETAMCPHTPPCPDAKSPDREAARTLASHPEQGWSLLCNGIVLFDDTGELLPDGDVIAPHRPTDLARRSPAAGRRAPRPADPAPAAGSGTGSWLPAPTR